MKLVRFEVGSAPRVGIVSGDGIIDLGRTPFPFTSVLEVIAAPPVVRAQLEKYALEGSQHYLLSNVRLLAPIPRPGKYLAIGMNYMKHAEEVARIGVAPEKRQYWFNKQTTCIAGPFDDIDPGVSEKIDYEVELGVVIGRPAKSVSASKARDYVFGYFVANDVSARDWQFHTPTFTMGKSFDTHGPTGPYIVTANEIENPHDLALRCLVNGEVRQSSNTSQMIYDIWHQIEYLSTAFTLEPGDLISTGTPDGVGAAMEPPRFLMPGDVVRCEIEKVGVIENRVATRTD